MATPGARLSADILVDDIGWRRAVPAIEALCVNTLTVAQRYLDIPAGLVELSVLLCGNDRIQTLNRTHRGIDKPTNVLSFPLFDVPIAHGAGIIALGDIAIALGVTRDEASANSRSLEHHVAHLLVHGLLHLCGHDHQCEADAERMEGLERLILRALDITDPYSDYARS